MDGKSGSDVDRLWAAHAFSIYGTWLAFGAFPLLAVRVLDVPAFAVSLLEAAGLAVAALVAVPLGPWVEHRRKRPVMIAMDGVRCLAMASVPVAYLLGVLTYGPVRPCSPGGSGRRRRGTRPRRQVTRS